MKRLFCCLFLSFILLSSCSSSEDTSLDPRFLTWFRPVAEESSMLDGGIRTPNIRVEYDDAILYLRQIIGNPYALYLAVDVIGSDVSINDVTFSGRYMDNGEPWLAFTGDGTVAVHQRPDLLDGYIIRLFSERPLDTNQELVMHLRAIRDPLDPSLENTIWGPYEISFVPDVNTAVRKASLIDGEGVDVGNLSVSALHIHIAFGDMSSLINPHFPNQTPIRVVMDDGTYRPLQWFGLGQPKEESSAMWWSLWSEHRRLWEPYRIVAVEIGEIRMMLD